jgi:hypothetical protein
MANAGFLVQESQFDPLACDGVRDEETIKGAPWSHIVWKPKHSVDPFVSRRAAEYAVAQVCDLGVPCGVFEVSP